MAQLTNRITTTVTVRSLVAVMVLAMVAIGVNGCASKTAHKWAQTSPVIAAEPQDTAVQLGAQGG